MANEHDDLWPDEIATANIQTPYLILRRQATFLTKRTNNVVVAEVGYVGKSERMHFAMDFVAPSLNNYRVRIIQVSHSVAKIYPVRINAPFIEPQTDLGRGITYEVNSEEEYRSKLREIFGSKEVVEIIRVLRSQSEGLKD